MNFIGFCIGFCSSRRRRRKKTENQKEKMLPLLLLRRRPASARPPACPSPTFYETDVPQETPELPPRVLHHDQGLPRQEVVPQVLALRPRAAALRQPPAVVGLEERQVVRERQREGAARFVRDVAPAVERGVMEINRVIQPYVLIKLWTLLYK